MPYQRLIDLSGATAAGKIIPIQNGGYVQASSVVCAIMTPARRFYRKVRSLFGFGIDNLERTRFSDHITEASDPDHICTLPPFDQTFRAF